MLIVFYSVQSLVLCVLMYLILSITSHFTCMNDLQIEPDALNPSCGSSDSTGDSSAFTVLSKATCSNSHIHSYMDGADQHISSSLGFSIFSRLGE